MGFKLTSGVLSQHKFNGFTLVFVTPSDNTAVTLPLSSQNSSATNCTVYWGDGTSSLVTAYDDADRIHTYALAGSYTVEIVGTCEGFSFNNGGSKAYLTHVLSWGTTGFKHLSAAFYGCSNLVSIPSKSIPVSGTGCINFMRSFQNCSQLSFIPPDLFKLHTNLGTSGFYYTFSGCSSITSVPPDLFRYGTGVAISAFYATFSGCSSLTTVPADIFRYNTAVTTSGFNSLFLNCISLTSIPTDLFRYNTSASTSAFQSAFSGCTSLTTVPADTFRYNVAVSSSGFGNTFFGCTNLTSVPEGLFKYNINVSSSGFYATFYGCTKLTLNKWIFYSAGEESTRFLNRVSNFDSCFKIASFTGSQGSAPELWNCSFGTQTPTKTVCWGDAGNSTTNLDNYASIPAAWK